MEFDKDTSLEAWGVKVGFVLSYLIFTTVLFLMSLILGKAWSIWSVIVFTSFVAVTGLILRRVL